jgi:tetratricopeptide (TPR) repeat protein
VTIRTILAGALIVSGVLLVLEVTVYGSSPAPVAPATIPSSRPASQPVKPDAADPENRTIRFLEDRVRRDPDDITALNRLSGEYLRRFRRSGDDRDLTLAATTAAQSLQSVPPAQNAAGLAARARALFALHGFAAARDMAMQLVASEPAKRYPFEILGDALMELGDYDQAADAYKKMQAFGDADINTETRLARLDLIRGDTATARRRLDSSVEMARAISPPAPDVLAWCLVQSGQLALNLGDWDRAERDYEAALDARPGDWSAVDHLAELRAAQKRYGEAVALYAPLVERVPRPELFQALGDVYAAMGKADEAKRWRGQALEKYLAAAATGSTHYNHHLAGFYSDIEPNPTEAVRWAKKDMESRHSVYAFDALGWALYQAGDYKPAAEAMDKALALGTRDAHLLYHSSLIYYRAGDAAKAKDCLRRAGEANPKFTEFHVHR